MKKFNSVSLIVAVLVLSACGSQSYKNTVASNATSTGTTVTTPTGTNPYGLPTATEQRVELSGQNGTNPIQTLNFYSSSKLRVKITPLAAPNVTIPGYTNWVFPYGCLQVTVTVNGITKMTQVLKVNGQASSSTCQNAPTSEVLDFTGQISGSGNVQVVVSNPNYDNCRYTWPMYYGCSMSAVWQNHRIATNVQVETDNTYMP